MYIIWFDCCALAVSIIILVSFYTRNSIPIIQNKVFILQVWTAIITTSCNLILGILQNMAQNGVAPEQLIITGVIAGIYHMFRMINAFLYIYYILVVLNIIDKSRFQFLYLYLPTLIALIICIFGSLTHYLFYIDTNGIHHAGPLMYILYVIALYYMLIIVGLTIYFRKVIPLPRRIAFHSFGTLAMAPVLIERLYPTFMIEGMGSVLCQLLIYLTIQKPEEVIDGTTGLLNRISFMRMITIKNKQKYPFDMIIITVKNYHFLEKSLGIKVIGQLMVQVGHYLHHLASKKAKVYYIADGTFCFMFNRRKGNETEEYMKIMQERSYAPWNINDLSINLAASLTAVHCPEEAETLEDVIELLGILLPNTHYKGQDYFENMSRREQAIIRAVSRALKNKTFRVVYQPIYSTVYKRFISAEALVRLYDDELGEIRPDEFIPIMEKNGGIVKIGQFVLESVCQFISENELVRKKLEYIEVNLSIVECLQDDLVSNILNVLNQYHIETRFINLEITETASNTLPEVVLQNINQLADKGIRFSLDDYGTGYSNISRIVTMPFHIIKLDRSIIQTYFYNKNKTADIVLEETLKMLKRLNQSVVAEGVETKEEAQQLIKMGCEFLQGYYYARPMSHQQFLELLKSENIGMR